MKLNNHLLHWRCIGICSDSARLGFLEFRRNFDREHYAIILHLSDDQMAGLAIEPKVWRTGYWWRSYRRRDFEHASMQLSFARVFSCAIRWRTWVSANRLWEIEQATPARAI